MDKAFDHVFTKFFRICFSLAKISCCTLFAEIEPTLYIDQFQENVNYGYGVGSSDQFPSWQEFVPDLPFLKEVELYLSKSGEPGDLTMKIVKVDGLTQVGEFILQGPVENRNPRFVFETAIPLVVGDLYRIELLASTSDSLNRYFWQGSTIPNAYRKGLSNLEFIGSAPSFDFAFKTFGYGSDSHFVAHGIRCSPASINTIAPGEEISVTFDYVSTNPGDLSARAVPYRLGEIVEHVSVLIGSIGNGTGTTTVSFSLPQPDQVVDEVGIQFGINNFNEILYEESFSYHLYSISDSGQLSVKHLSPISGGIASGDLLWEPEFDLLYVSNLYGPITVLSASTGNVEATIQAKGDSISISSDNSELWAVSQIDGKATVIDIKDGSSSQYEVIAIVENILYQSTDIVCTKFGYAYVGSSSGITVVNMNSREVISTIGDINVHELTLSEDQKSVYVSAYWDMQRLDTNPDSSTFNTITEKLEIVQDVRSTIPKDDEQTFYVFIGKYVAKVRKQDPSGFRVIETMHYNLSPDVGASGELLMLGHPGEGSLVPELWVMDHASGVVTDRIPLPGEFVGVTAGPENTAFVWGSSTLKVTYSTDDTSPPVVPEAVNARGEEGMVTIPVNAAGSNFYPVYSTTPWINIIEPRPLGNGSQDVSLFVFANLNDELRVGEIYIADQLVKVFQEPANEQTYLSSYESEMGSSGGGIFLEIYSNENWSASDIPDWIELNSSAEGELDGYLSLMVLPNSTSVERIAEILVNDIVFKVTQQPGPFILDGSSSNGSGGLGTGVHEVTISGQPVAIIVGDGYDPRRPSILCYYLHGDEGFHHVFNSPDSKVRQLINEFDMVFAAPQAPEAPLIPGAFPWDGRGGGDQAANVEQIKSVLDYMTEHYNVLTNIYLGAGVSGGSWIHDSVFFPRYGADYPSSFLLGCGAAGLANGMQYYSSALLNSQKPEIVSQAELNYTIGTSDFLYPNAFISASTYSFMGYSVLVDFMEGVAHCELDLDRKVEAYWRKKINDFIHFSNSERLNIIEGQWIENPDSIGWIYGLSGFSTEYSFSSQLGFIYHLEFPWIYDLEWGWLYFLTRDESGRSIHFYHPTLGFLTISDADVTGRFYCWNLDEYDNFFNPEGRIIIP